MERNRGRRGEGFVFKERSTGNGRIKKGAYKKNDIARGASESGYHPAQIEWMEWNLDLGRETGTDVMIAGQVEGGGRGKGERDGTCKQAGGTRKQ